MEDDAIDYINIKRIEELCIRLFKKIPATDLTGTLKRARILKFDGSFDQKYVQTELSGGRYLFDYITHREAEHYKQLMLEIGSSINFIDLDSTSQSWTQLKEAEGHYAFFVGSVCAKGPKFPITETTPPIVMHYTRKALRIEWTLDPVFLMSASAIGRIGGRNRYMIYCLVRTVEKLSDEMIKVKASPLLIAQPKT